MSRILGTGSHSALLIGLVAACALGAEQAGAASATSVALEDKYVAHPRESPIQYLSKAVPTTISGPATLTLNIDGDLDAADEYVTVRVDGVTVGVVLQTGGGDCFQKKTVTISIPEATLAPLISDGLLDITLTPSYAVSPKCDTPCYTIRADGTLSFYAGLSPHEEKSITSSSISKSRTAITISSLPNLSKRLSRGSFGGTPAPRAPSGGAPSGGGAPGGGLPGAGTSSTGASFPGSANNGVAFSGYGTSSGGSISFSGDLSSIRQAGVAKELTRRFAAYSDTGAGADYLARNGVGAEDRGGVSDERMAAAQTQAAAFGGVPEPQTVDMWFGGSFTYFDTELGGLTQSGGVGSLQMGIDARFGDDLLLGVALFGDYLLSDVSSGAHSHGLGLMAGPYAVVNLQERIYLEVMAAYGRAFNRIDASDGADSRYQSERVLLTGRLSGDFKADDWTVRPSTRVTYYSELQESFDAGDGTTVAAARSELGQVRFGPELAREFFWEDGALRPFMGLEGVWAFKQTDQVVEGAEFASDELTGSFSLGVDAFVSGASLRASGRYDGIGEPGLHAVTGELTLRVPFE